MSDVGDEFPKLEWPLEPKNHKDFLKVHEEVNVWIQKFCDVANISEVIDDLKLTYFATRVWNSASYKRLLTLSKLVVFFFFADDFFEKKSVEWTQYQTRRMIEIARSDELVDLDGNNNWIEATFSDVWQGISVLGPDHWKDRFIHSLNLWFRPATWEHKYSVNNLPSFVEYVALRPFSEGAEFCFNFIEFAANKYLTTKQAAEPMYQAMLMHTRYVCFLTNDLYSYRKEMKSGHIMNIVFVFQKKYNLSLTQAVNRTVKFTKEHHDMYLCCREQLNTIFPDEYGFIIGGLEDMMIGNYYFHFESKRYTSV